MADLETSIIVKLKDIATAGFKTIKDGIKGVGDTTTGAKDKLKDFEDKLGDILKSGVAVAAPFLAAATAVLGFGTAAVKSSADNEQFIASLTTMTKSSETAKELLDKLKEFAIVTPFELTTLKDMTKTLIAYGFGAGDVIPVLKMLGDVAASVGTDKLPTLVEAFGKIGTKGKADMEQLNRILEAGVPILDELAIAHGTNTKEIFKLVEQGKIGFNDVNDALTSLTTGTGIYTGAMEKQSKTLGGMISNIKDYIGQAMVGIGDVFLDDVKGLAGKVQTIFTGDSLKNITGWFIIARKKFLDLKNDILDLKDFFSVAGIGISDDWQMMIGRMREGLLDNFFLKMPDFMQKYFSKAIGFMTVAVEESKEKHKKNTEEIDDILQKGIERRAAAQRSFDKQVDESTALQVVDHGKKEELKTKKVEVETAKRVEQYNIDWKKLKETYDFDISEQADATKKKKSVFDTFTLENAKGVDGLIKGIQDIGDKEAAVATARKVIYERNLEDMKKMEQAGSYIAKMFEVGDEDKIKMAVDGLTGYLSASLKSSFDIIDPTGFLGGFGVGLVQAAVKSIFGGSSTYKSIFDLNKEKFEELVENTNVALSDIGREKTVTEKQISALKKLETAGQINLTTQQKMDLGTPWEANNIQDAIQILTKQQMDLNSREMATKQKEVTDAQKIYNDLYEQRTRAENDLAKEKASVKAGTSKNIEENKRNFVIEQAERKIAETNKAMDDATKRINELNYERRLSTIDLASENVVLQKESNDISKKRVENYLESANKVDELLAKTDKEAFDYTAAKAGNTAYQAKEYIEWKLSNDNLTAEQKRTNELLSQLISKGAVPITIDGKVLSSATQQYNPAVAKMIEKGVL